MRELIVRDIGCIVVDIQATVADYNKVYSGVVLDQWLHCSFLAEFLAKEEEINSFYLQPVTLAYIKILRNLIKARVRAREHQISKILLSDAKVLSYLDYMTKEELFTYPVGWNKHLRVQSREPLTNDSLIRINDKHYGVAEVQGDSILLDRALEEEIKADEYLSVTDYPVKDISRVKLYLSQVRHLVAYDGVKQKNLHTYDLIAGL